MLIYMVTNIVNNKQYVGQTINSLRQRKRQHINSALKQGSKLYFHRAIKKYGVESFEWVIIHDDITNMDDLNRLEIYYIGKYDSFENGYNLTLGGGGSMGWIPSEKTRRNISKANRGKYHSDKTKKRMSESHKGEKFSEDRKRKMSEAQLGEKNHRFGKKHTTEALKRLSEANSGKNNPRARAVLIHNKYFDTGKEAAEFFGVTPGAICNGIARQQKGYKYARGEYNDKEETTNKQNDETR